MLIIKGSVQRRLRKVEYNGRYSLVLWFGESREYASFAGMLSRAWEARREPHDVIDAVSLQEGGALVVQSTVQMWRVVSEGKGGGNPLRTIANKESNVGTDVGVAKSLSDWSKNPSTNQIAIYM